MLTSETLSWTYHKLASPRSTAGLLKTIHRSFRFCMKKAHSAPALAARPTDFARMPQGFPCASLSAKQPAQIISFHPEQRSVVYNRNATASRQQFQAVPSGRFVLFRSFHPLNSSWPSPKNGILSTQGHPQSYSECFIFLHVHTEEARRCITLCSMDF